MTFPATFQDNTQLPYKNHPLGRLLSSGGMYGSSAYQEAIKCRDDLSLRRKRGNFLITFHCQELFKKPSSPIYRVSKPPDIPRRHFHYQNPFKKLILFAKNVPEAKGAWMSATCQRGFPLWHPTLFNQ